WSRILDEAARIEDIVNNYSRISFNFGPTLLSWMAESAPETYLRIIEADKLSAKRFGGHGSAIAQGYNHMIMPLADAKMKQMQVEWGIRDFADRFGRDPEGMWLPETAVDSATLEVLAANGIKFTLLAPRQAKSVRDKGGKVWHDVTGARVDTRQAYHCPLPSGKSIDLFFYDGSLAQDIAFKGLLDNGNHLYDRLMESFGDSTSNSRIVQVATDGESYGHHHKFGDMPLAFALNRIESNPEIRLTNYGEFLELQAPTTEVEIVENSSWSCVHGIERWRSDCGCGKGGDEQTLEWRAPLRDALDQLRDGLDEVWNTQAKDYFKDPEQARINYIDLVLDRSIRSKEQFLAKYMHEVSDADRETNALRLLEMTRQSMLMYTSCAWFFDDVCRIEPTQVLRYANRAMQLGETLSGKALEADFTKILESAPSNNAQYPTASAVYNELAAPSRLTLSGVGMHYAVYSLFEELEEEVQICNYLATSQIYEKFEAGIQRLAMGRTTVKSNITHSRKYFSFAVFYLGQHQIIGQLDDNMTEETFRTMFEEVKVAFMESRIADVLSLMQKHFDGKAFSFWNLFRDEQRKVLNKIVERDLNSAENSYRKIFDRNYNIMNVMRSADLPIPEIFARNLEVVINTEIRKIFDGNALNARKLEKLALQALKWDVDLDKALIAYAASERILSALKDYEKTDDPTGHLQRINKVFKVLGDLDIQPDLWKIQNRYFLHSKSWVDKPTKLSDEFLDEWIKLGVFIKVKSPI
ncbi:MAG: hypothetical protein ACI959_001919, partial [Limisphaerales bacterium]